MNSLAVLVLLLMLFAWVRWHRQDAAARAEQRQAECPHPPELIQTIRVNNIITMNGAMIHRVIPGRRWLQKRCRQCDKRWNLYAGQQADIQPWDKYLEEFQLETIDRTAQFKARHRLHLQEQAEEERARIKRRANFGKEGKG